MGKIIQMATKPPTSKCPFQAVINSCSIFLGLTIPTSKIWINSRNLHEPEHVGRLCTFFGPSLSENMSHKYPADPFTLRLEPKCNGSTYVGAEFSTPLLQLKC